MQPYQHAKLIPATTITGSIVGYWANATTTISDSVWGNYSGFTGLGGGAIASDPGMTVVSTTGLSVAAGILLRGPIIALTTNAVGIVYYNGTLQQTDA